MDYEESIQPLRGENTLRILHRILPLGRKYHPILTLFNKRQGLIAVPFAMHFVITPASWGKQIVNYLLTGSDFIPEISLLEPLCRNLKEGIILDIGANTGLYVLFIRNYSNLPIVAYEPDPFLFKLLNQTIAYNAIQNIKIKNVACGNERSELAFAMGINGSVVVDTVNNPSHEVNLLFYENNWDREAQETKAGNLVIKVPAVALDEELVNGPKVAMMKIDCEGYECHILKGAKDLIAQHKPYLFLELHPTMLNKFNHTSEDVLELLNPYYHLQYWCYQHNWPTTKLGRSLMKFRKSKAHQYEDADEMLADIKSNPGISQVYLVGHPKED